MALDLNATPGSPLANSYVTMDAAAAFLEPRLDTEPWDEAHPDAQEQALVWATQLLDQQVSWYGMPSTETQALAWPQTGQSDKWGRPIDPTLVPQAVQQATAYYALALLAANTDDGASTSGDLVLKSKKIGDTTIEYQNISSSTARAPVSPYALPADVKALLRPYGAVAGMLSVPLVRS